MPPAEAHTSPRPDHAQALSVARVKLSEFRNYSALDLAVDRRMVVLTGANGAGKTNLLEALSFLAPGRGLRFAKLKEVDRENGIGPWAVAAELRTPHGTVKLGTSRQDELGRADRRAVKIDGEPASGPNQLADYTSVIWLTPAMDRLFAEGSAQRRRFFDRLVFNLDSAHARAVGQYEHSIRERARVLRGHADPAWLGALEKRAAGAAMQVVRARRATLAGLQEALAQQERPFPQPELRLRGKVEGWLDEVDEAGAMERLRATWQEQRPRDAELGGALTGPHRSDLIVRDIAQDQPAAMVSTGRQKALLLSIVLAKTRLRAQRGMALPLLLLDEVVAHLDAVRRAHLFDELRDLGAQAWLTGTDRALFAPLGHAAQHITVNAAECHTDEPTPHPL